MNFSFNKLLSSAAIIIFIAYWVLVPILTIPHVPEQKRIAAHFPFVGRWFAFNWQFFAKPFTYNDRMYIVSRQKNNPTITDTVEVLEHIAISKQNAAPFNQKENITDHFVNYYVTDIKRLVFRSRDELRKKFPGQPDSFYNPISLQLAKEKKLMRPDSIALHNYCRGEISKRLKDVSTLQYKFILSSRSVPKFEDRFKKDHTPTETIFFETAYSNY